MLLKKQKQIISLKQPQSKNMQYTQKNTLNQKNRNHH